MLIPRFWARAEGAATHRDGRRLLLRLWGWSQESAADALDLARRRVVEATTRLAADPDFVRLCRLQRSFRARLTPKPWRLGVKAPPGQHPRDPVAQAAFGAWLLKYELASRGYATCQFVEAVGPPLPSSEARAVVDEHDRTTRAGENLPLA